MDDPTTLTIGGAIIAALGTAFGLVIRLAWRRMELVLLAAIERARIREQRRLLQPPPKNKRDPDSGDWEQETTDLHELIEIERMGRKRRDTDQRLRRHGERKPRPGTHHDGED